MPSLKSVSNFIAIIRWFFIKMLNSVQIPTYGEMSALTADATYLTLKYLLFPAII